MLVKIPVRMVFALICLVAVSLLTGASILSEVVGIRPCYLCNFQRFMYLLIVFFSAGGAMFVRGRKVWSVFTAAAATSGVATALWQSWVQWFPDQTDGCGVGPANLLEQTVDMLSALWPDMFMVFGDCADDSWRFLDGSLANWSVFFFLVLLFLSVCCFIQSSSFRLDK